MNARILLLLGVIVAGTAVGLGALGAHWFETKAQTLYSDPELQHKRVEAWKTGAQYQMYHGLALLAAGLCALYAPAPQWSIAGVCFLIGVLLFSGSLYTIGLSGVTDWKAVSKAWLAVIIATPLGGTFFLLGWAAFAWGVVGMNAPLPKP